MDTSFYKPGSSNLIVVEAPFNSFFAASSFRKNMQKGHRFRFDIKVEIDVGERILVGCFQKQNWKHDTLLYFLFRRYSSLEIFEPEIELKAKNEESEIAVTNTYSAGNLLLNAIMRHFRGRTFPLTWADLVMTILKEISRQHLILRRQHINNETATTQGNNIKPLVSIELVRPNSYFSTTYTHKHTHRCTLQHSKHFSFAPANINDSELCVKSCWKDSWTVSFGNEFLSAIELTLSNSFWTNVYEFNSITSRNWWA